MSRIVKNQTTPTQCRVAANRPIRALLLVLCGCVIGLGAVADQLIGNVVGTNSMPKVVNGGDVMSAGEPKINVAVQTMLSQRLGGSVSESLLKNQFVSWENVMLRRERVSVGDLKKLFKYSDGELDPVPSTGFGFPAYYLPFADVRCVIEVAEERKSIYDNATLVTVTISTNPLPASAPGSVSTKSRWGIGNKPQNK